MTENKATSPSQSIDQNILQTLALDYLKEKRRRRRCGIFFKLAVLFVIVLFLLKLIPGKKMMGINAPHTALIEISGTISEMSKTNADNLAKSLRQAFSNEASEGIILRINSPGGSAVQADLIFNEIQRLRQENPDKKVYAVCTDVCASAAYYIASATDEVYANPSSLVGSIGVLYNGFGFADSLEKLGIERRLLTAGKYKAFLDPFSPPDTDEEAIMQNMLDEIHQRFEQSVIQGRGERLTGDPEILYSGLIWTGLEAKKLGLIDGFNSAGGIARDIIQNENIVDYTVKPGYFDRLGLKFSSQLIDNVLERIGMLPNDYRIES